ncbi:MAG: PKD domain-containing protein [Bacteroidetes bacterium]|nr:PKD domain-containing protein [Bacteroidota bacterium]
MIQRTLILILILSSVSCGQKDSELYVPYGEPQPPKVLNIVKLDLNCSMPFNVHLIGQVSNKLGNELYEWDVDGTKFYDVSPIIQVSKTGNVNVKLTVTNSIGSDTMSVVFSYPSTTLPVVPNFNYGATNNNFRIPAEINFTDLSERATGVKWDFGDGYQSTLQNPKHIYQIPGTYTIVLTAYCDSDTARQSASITIDKEPSTIQFNQFDLLGIPKNYIPENQDDKTTGGDFYLNLLRDNFKYGSSNVMSNRSKTPVTWKCPADWNGDYKLVYYSFGTYITEIWDKNDHTDTQILSATFDATYLRSNYYPTSLDFESNGFKFRIHLSYEN